MRDRGFSKFLPAVVVAILLFSGMAFFMFGEDQEEGIQTTSLEDNSVRYQSVYFGEIDKDEEVLDDDNDHDNQSGDDGVKDDGNDSDDSDDSNDDDNSNIKKEEVQDESTSISNTITQALNQIASPVVSILNKEEDEVVIEEVVIEKPKPEGPLPDIVLKSLSHYGALLKEGEIINFAVTVVNAGVADFIGATTTLSLDRGDDGIYDFIFALRGVGLLEPGDEETKFWLGAWNQEGGTHRIRACVDTDDTVIEQDESNNCSSIVLTVQSKKHSADMSALSGTIFPVNPSVGENISFFGTFVNNGKERAPTHFAALRVDGRLISKLEVPPVDVGASVSLEWSNVWKAKGEGSHTFTVCADITSIFSELNEEDNCLQTPFYITQ